MKNLFKLFGIIAIAALIGFSFVSCQSAEDGPKDELDGTTWKYEKTYESGDTVTQVFTFNSPNFNYTSTL